MDRRLVDPPDLPAPRSSAPDYYAVLSSVIEASKDNPAQLRNLVYELARVNLKREIFVRHPLIRKADVERQMRELEEAIERVENTSDDDSLMPLRRPLLLEAASDDSDRAQMLAPRRGLAAPDRETLMAQFRPAEGDAPISAQQPLCRDRAVWTGVRSALQIIGASIIGTLVFAVLTGQVDLGRLRKVEQAAVPANVIKNRFPDVPLAQSDRAAVADLPPRVAPAGPPIPLPTNYGIYAVSDGQLVELERLSMRVPDARVFISPDIKEPSQTTLPDGKAVFVVFRHEWPGGVPDKVAVRVVARVVREMTFKDGKAVVSAVTNMWRIRGNSYELRVGPVADNLEMLVARPENDFALPPGRYALVLNGLGYDFTVAGTITDPVQCLERTEAVGGAIYSECRNP